MKQLINGTIIEQANSPKFTYCTCDIIHHLVRSERNALPQYRLCRCWAQSSGWRNPYIPTLSVLVHGLQKGKFTFPSKVHFSVMSIFSVY